MIFNNIAIFVNKDKAQAYKLGRRLVKYCEEHSLAAAMLPADAAFLDHGELGRPLNNLREWAHLVISLGGDGTLLGAARLFASAGVPVLGINLGHLGFLTAAEPDHIEQMFLDLVAGQFNLDERHLLKAQIWRNDQQVAEFQALNDVVITKNSFSHIKVICYVGSEYLATYPGDGVIVATATGSTAYTLSAGGPIVSPDLECLIITPICAHAFGARSLIISGRETFKAVVTANKGDLMLAVDGQEIYPLELKDQIQVTLAAEKAKFIRLPGQEFYRALRTRLKDSCFKLPTDETDKY
ncbi:MAG: NAD(+)/NADH kinase [bacterium]|jgi:NAD+ kinase